MLKFLMIGSSILVLSACTLSAGQSYGSEDNSAKTSSKSINVNSHALSSDNVGYITRTLTPDEAQYLERISKRIDFEGFLAKNDADSFQRKLSSLIVSNQSDQLEEWSTIFEEWSIVFENQKIKDLLIHWKMDSFQKYNVMDAALSVPSGELLTRATTFNDNLQSIVNRKDFGFQLWELTKSLRSTLFVFSLPAD